MGMSRALTDPLSSNEKQPAMENPKKNSLASTPAPFSMLRKSIFLVKKRLPKTLATTMTTTMKSTANRSSAALPTHSWTTSKENPLNNSSDKKASGASSSNTMEATSTLAVKPSSNKPAETSTICL